MSPASVPAEQLAKSLASGLQQTGCEMAGDIQTSLLDYISLLDKWNKTYNLTAVRDIRQMVSQHLLDSLSINQYLRGDRILDVGTGAGLPGIPLAVANPDKTFVLLDSAMKRTRFVTQVVGELGLTNVEVVQSRIEAYEPEQAFDTIVSRAFTAMADFVRATERLCRDEGQLLAMKGRFPTQEINDLPENWQARTDSLDVPGIEAERHLVILSRK